MKIAILSPVLRLSGIYFWIDLMALIMNLSKKHKVVFRFNDSSAPLDVKREGLAESALKWGADYLFFLDSDMRFGIDIFDRLVKWKKDIVSGMYIDRYGKNICKLKGQKEILKGCIKKKKEQKKLIQIESTGFGCLLVKSRVFRELKRPWFEWKIGRPEDLDWCIKTNEQGFKIYADPSTFVGHGFSERRQYL